MVPRIEFSHPSSDDSTMPSASLSAICVSICTEEGICPTGAPIVPDCPCDVPRIPPYRCIDGHKELLGALRRPERPIGKAALNARKGKALGQGQRQSQVSGDRRYSGDALSWRKCKGRWSTREGRPRRMSPCRAILRGVRQETESLQSIGRVSTGGIALDARSPCSMRRTNRFTTRGSNCEPLLRFSSAMIFSGDMPCR